jgi:hypothetical protein
VERVEPVCDELPPVEPVGDEVPCVEPLRDELVLECPPSGVVAADELWPPSTPVVDELDPHATATTARGRHEARLGRRMARSFQGEAPILSYSEPRVDRGWRRDGRSPAIGMRVRRMSGAPRLESRGSKVQEMGAR